MIAAFLTMWLAIIGQAPPPPDLHLAIEFRFSFMANANTRNTD